MSDALTDIARDEKRSKFFEDYLKTVKNYLSKPSLINFGIVVRTAKALDSVPGGYFGGPAWLSKDIKERLKKLRNNDKQEWAKFLSSIIKSRYFQIFKALSPFKDKMILQVHYGGGWGPDIEGEIKNLIAQIIREKKNWTTHDCDSYLVVIDAPSFENADAFWLKCGIGGITGPRKNKSK